MTYADQYERYMLDLINADRAKLGADPLMLERNLNQASEDHSKWMLRTDDFSHTGVGGSSPTERMRDADFDFSGAWRSAENIAVQSERGSTGIKDDVADLHASLMASSGHYRNLMNPDLDYIGIGIEVGNFNFGSGSYRSVIVTQTFASTNGSVDLDSRPAATPTSKSDTLTGTSKADRMAGGFGNDVIHSKAGGDVVYGDAGQDVLVTGRGADSLWGGRGQDTLTGGRGDDTVTGGRGEDHFVFRRGDDRDVIRDFQNNIDTVDLRDFGFASKTAALRQATMNDGDLVFKFGDGDTLTLLDTSKSVMANDLLI